MNLIAHKKPFWKEHLGEKTGENLHVDNGLNDKTYRAGTFMLDMLYDWI